MSGRRNGKDRAAEPGRWGRADVAASRLATARLRQPPDFVVIGAQRGGTTSLYRYLTGHPEVGGALRKEVHFFDQNYEKGVDWYLAHFPLRGEARLVGEASPFYLVHPEVPGRMRATVPGVKLIALLRNPVERAYSQYQLNVRRGLEPFSFAEAIAQEEARLAGATARRDLAARRSSYLLRGRYVEHVRRWLDVFPSEQFLIFKSEELFEEPGRILGQALAYLGVESTGWEPPRFRAFHRAGYPELEAATRARLAAYFAPYNRRLAELLGRDFGWE